MECVKWTDIIRNEAVLERVGEERMMLKLIRKRKRNWLGHWLRRNCLLKDALEGMYTVLRRGCNKSCVGAVTNRILSLDRIVCKFLFVRHDDDDDDDGDDDDEQLNLVYDLVISPLKMSMQTVVAHAAYLLLNRRRKRSQRKTWCRQISINGDIPRNYFFFNKLLADDAYLFRNFTLLSKEDFNYSVNKAAPLTSKFETNYRDSTPTEVKLHYTLRFCATGDSCRSLMYLFRIFDSAISVFIPNVCEAISGALKNYTKLRNLSTSTKCFFENDERDSKRTRMTSRDSKDKCNEHSERERQLVLFVSTSKVLPYIIPASATSPNTPLSVRGETPPPSRSASGAVAEDIQRRLTTFHGGRSREPVASGGRLWSDLRDDEERLIEVERKWRIAPDIHP
ncbi:hypothetical protein ANN_01273 [Periplaneta americana]|uniref:Uncharacterized protein n=1 Tax=Periplaneta americana TaxID=6978 RepID=A0ABQ8TW08_PERAM|nr:hypothetical protein ANN_01273 [Periplaneta americana]